MNCILLSFSGILEISSKNTQNQELLSLKVGDLYNHYCVKRESTRTYKIIGECLDSANNKVLTAELIAEKVGGLYD